MHFRHGLWIAACVGALAGCAGSERRATVVPAPEKTTPATDELGPTDLGPDVEVPGALDDADVLLPASGELPDVEGEQEGAGEVTPDNTGDTSAAADTPGTAGAGAGAGAAGAGTTAPNGWSGATDEISAKEPWAIASLDPGVTVSDDGKLVFPGGAAADPAAGAGAGAGAGSGAATAKVSYQKDVKRILDANCTQCHSAGGSRSTSPMASFAEAKAQGSGIVSRSDGGGMPPGKTLPAADINVLKEWRAAGFLEVAP